MDEMGEDVRFIKFKRGVTIDKIPDSAEGGYLCMDISKNQFNMWGERKLIINRDSQQLTFIDNLYISWHEGELVVNKWICQES